jgi:hypothetical protein
MPQVLFFSFSSRIYHAPSLSLSLQTGGACPAAAAACFPDLSPHSNYCTAVAATHTVTLGQSYLKRFGYNFKPYTYIYIYDITLTVSRSLSQRHLHTDSILYTAWHHTITFTASRTHTHLNPFATNIKRVELWRGGMSLCDPTLVTIIKFVRVCSLVEELAWKHSQI